MLPKNILLTCHTGKVSVRPAFTMLFSGDFIPGKDKLVAFWWKPNEQMSVAVLSCEPREERKPGDEWGSLPLSYLAPLAFVSGKAGTPPIEWAFQNDDMSLQEGTYRWMPAR